MFAVLPVGLRRLISLPGNAMILAVDVSYQANKAVAAGVLFDAWDDCDPSKKLATRLTGVAVYEPGQFYKRELPC